MSQRCVLSVPSTAKGSSGPRTYASGIAMARRELPAGKGQQRDLYSSIALFLWCSKEIGQATKEGITRVQGNLLACSGWPARRKESDGWGLTRRRCQCQGTLAKASKGRRKQQHHKKDEGSPIPDRMKRSFFQFGERKELRCAITSLCHRSLLAPASSSE